MTEHLGHLIDGKWIPGTGERFSSTNPATGEAAWRGHAATADEIDAAVASAREAAGDWASEPREARIAAVKRIGEQYALRKVNLASAISIETGKPRWEALAEVEAMIAKVSISIDAYADRTPEPASTALTGVTAATRYKPHGVVAVFGPFNMPGHLPNGHLVPAVLAGNTAIFKPSEQTPFVGQALAEAWNAADLPAGVFNLLQGGRLVGERLAAHAGIDGIFFTGSAAVGKSLSRAVADRPGVILALEMGGNNPLIVHECADLDAAAHLTVLSAYITAGQRCSCARRLIVPDGHGGDLFIHRLVSLIGQLRVGLPTDDPEPFMGPVISDRAAASLLDAQAKLINCGGRTFVEMKASPRLAALLSSGLIDVTNVSPRDDEELFGPILQLIRVPDFDAAVREANNTRYGLSAGLLSDRRDLYERFYRQIRAGVVNWNRQLTGASSRLPFGGVGASGNSRPSAYFAADYCAYPIATMEATRLAMPETVTPGIPR